MMGSTYNHKPVTRQSLKYMNRILIKVGSGVVMHSDGSVALGRLGHLVEQICSLVKDGKQILLISSGAIGVGKQKIQQNMLLSQPLRAHVTGVEINKKLDDRACAAAGQSGLMAFYEMLFSQKQISCSQVLLSDDNFRTDKGRKDISDTVTLLLNMGIVPILNENDVVSFSGNSTFFDNDSLASLVGNELKMDLTILLSDVEGLYREVSTGNRKPQVIWTYITSCPPEYKLGKKSGAGRGGMKAKIDAAVKALAGVKAVVIASGFKSEVITRIVQGRREGSLFVNHIIEEEVSLAQAARKAREASLRLQQMSSEARKEIVQKIARKIWENRQFILTANAKDVKRNSKQVANSSLKPNVSSSSGGGDFSKNTQVVPSNVIHQINLKDLKVEDANCKSELSSDASERARDSHDNFACPKVLNSLCESIPREQVSLVFRPVDPSIQSNKSIELTESLIKSLVDETEKIASLPDPLGCVSGATELAPNLVLHRETVPIGVVMVIVESQPAVLALVASLMIRSGNGLLFRGSDSVSETTRAVCVVVNQVIDSTISIIETKEAMEALLEMNEGVDLVALRGSRALVESVQSLTHIPVLGHAEGICHVFIDQAALLDKAVAVTLDSKTNAPMAGNSVETLLVHRAWKHIHTLIKILQTAHIKLYAGPNAMEFIEHWNNCKHAKHGENSAHDEVIQCIEPANDFHMEYGSLSLTIEIVDSVYKAISHINHYSSSHTDAIVTEDKETAKTFFHLVDSACVFHNSSTRFSDGSRFGLGAEVGISTSRIHARGPLGMSALVTTKWILDSSEPSGSIVSDFGLYGPKEFTHKSLKSKL